MNRLELIRAADWSVSKWLIELAAEHGCTCQQVVLHDRGFDHQPGCRLAHPAHHVCADHWWTPVDQAVLERLDRRMEFIVRNTCALAVASMS